MNIPSAPSKLGNTTKIDLAKVLIPACTLTTFMSKKNTYTKAKQI